MSVARLGKNVYLVASREQGDQGNSYLLRTDSHTFLIDTGGTEEPINVLRNVLEVTNGSSIIDYLILTSCLRDAAAGAYFLYQELGIKVVIHEHDSIGLRHGICANTVYRPSNVYMVLRQNRASVDGLEVIRSASPTLGSVLLKFGEYLFVGASKLSPADPKIKYVLGLYEYVRL